jgi:hypothetical protein
LNKPPDLCFAEVGARAQGVEKLEQPSSTERGEASTRKPPAHRPEPPETSLAVQDYCDPRQRYCRYRCSTRCCSGRRTVRVFARLCLMWSIDVDVRGSRGNEIDSNLAHRISSRAARSLAMAGACSHPRQAPAVRGFDEMAAIPISTKGRIMNYRFIAAVVLVIPSLAQAFQPIPVPECHAAGSDASAQETIDAQSVEPDGSSQGHTTGRAAMRWTPFPNAPAHSTRF